MVLLLLVQLFLWLLLKNKNLITFGLSFFSHRLLLLMVRRRLRRTYAIKHVPSMWLLLLLLHLANYCAMAQWVRVLSVQQRMLLLLLLRNSRPLLLLLLLLLLALQLHHFLLLVLFLHCEVHAEQKVKKSGLRIQQKPLPLPSPLSYNICCSGCWYCC